MENFTQQYQYKAQNPEEQSVIQGKEFGFIKFGLFLPLDTKITVENGQITTGGQTVIAELG